MLDPGEGGICDECRNVPRRIYIEPPVQVKHHNRWLMEPGYKQG